MAKVYIIEDKIVFLHKIQIPRSKFQNPKGGKHRTSFGDDIYASWRLEFEAFK